MIQQHLNKLLCSGKSLTTVKDVRLIWNQILDFAISNKILDSNPSKETKIKSRAKAEHTEECFFLSPDLRKELLSAVNGNAILKPIITTLLLAGLRSGELLALRWKYIHFDESTILIEEAVTTKPEINDDGKRTGNKSIISDPKTDSSIRCIIIPESLITVLIECKEHQQAEEIKCGKELTAKDNFVFCNRFGEMRNYSGYRSLFRRFIKANGFEKYGIHPHTLRHTYATMLLEAGENPKVVQQTLGHNDIKTTLGTYSHVIYEVFESAANNLDVMYKRMAVGL